MPHPHEDLILNSRPYKWAKALADLAGSKAQDALDLVRLVEHSLKIGLPIPARELKPSCTVRGVIAVPASMPWYMTRAELSKKLTGDRALLTDIDVHMLFAAGDWAVMLVEGRVMDLKRASA